MIYKKVETTFFTIATNQYFELWAQQFHQALPLLSPEKNYQWVVLTNMPKAITARVSSPSNIRLTFAKASHTDWPEVTLFRYEMIYENRQLIQGDCVAWIDADMKLKAAPELRQPSNIHVCPHPGFNFISQNLKPAAIPFFIWTSMKNLVLHSGGLGTLGDWSSRRTSLSWVPYLYRKSYFHGAYWFGSKAVVLSFCKLMARRTRLDYQRGVIAKWHDESHLNWYAALYPKSITSLGIGSSYWSKNPTLRNSQAIVESVDKKLTKQELRSRKN